MTRPQSPASRVRPLEQDVCVPCPLLYNRRTRLDTRALGGGAVLLLLSMGLGGQQGVPVRE